MKPVDISLYDNTKLKDAILVSYQPSPRKRLSIIVRGTSHILECGRCYPPLGFDTVLMCDEWKVRHLDYSEIRHIKKDGGYAMGVWFELEDSELMDFI